MLPTPAELIATLDRFVLGQERAKRDLATAVYNHCLAAAWRESHGGRGGGDDFGRQHVLLIGPTGTGKTYLVTRLAEALGVPVACCSATSLVEAGYRGQEIEGIIGHLRERAGGDARQAERGILFLDEVDKIRRRDTGGQRDVSGEGVQNGLLTMLDGRQLHGVDTGRVLFIAAGAFSGLADLVRARLGSGRQMGFGAAEAGPSRPPDDYAALERAELADLVAYGFIPEFVGRFAVVSPLQALGVDELAGILRRAESSIYVRQRELFALHGIELEFTEDALRALAARALALGTGARALNRLLLQALDPVDWRLPELAAGGVTRIRFTAAALEPGAEPELVRGVLPADVRLRLEQLRRQAAPHAPRAVAPLLRPAALGDDEARQRYEQLRDGRLALPHAPATARRWWAHLEELNAASPHLLLAIADQLAVRQATIAEFHLAFLYADTGSLPAALHYLDYVRAKNAAGEKGGTR
jgi:ATP-dependent Clp protease ATP-binding subunit ClpX